MRREAGGPSEGLRLIVRGYLQQGHSAEIATLDPETTFFPDVPVPVHALGRRTFGYGYSPSLRRFLREHAGRFDGLVVHGLWQYHGLAALWEFRRKHRYAVFPHGMLDPWFNHAYPLKLLKKLPYWLLVERHVLAAAQAVLFTSSEEARLARHSFPGSSFHSVVVPYGTLGPPGDLEQELAAFHRRLPGLAGRQYILYAGRMHAKKGCDLLLRAYARVGRSGTPLPILVMAGPDECGLAAGLQALARREGIADRVLWPGMLTGAAKWGAFRGAQAFALLSHQENFGIAVAEALSCSTPVLISDKVNIHADIFAGGAGLVEPDTLEGAVRLLRRWSATSPADREAMARNAFTCWRTRFNSAGTPHAIAQFFQERRQRAHNAAAPGRPRRRRDDVPEVLSGLAPEQPEQRPA